MSTLDPAQPLPYWLHAIDPIVFRLTDTLAVRWYGLAYLTGFAVGWLILTWMRRRRVLALDGAGQERLIFSLVLGVVLGGRLGYLLFYRWGEFLSDPLLLFKVWEGGMSSHGGMLGVLVACWWVARREQTSFLRLGDVLCLCAPAGIMLGRAANFINGELWGHPADLPWAVLFPAAPWDPSQVSVWVESWGTFMNPRHPYPLYAVVLEGMIPLVWLLVRFRRIGQIRPGRLGGEFLLLYAAGRVIGECFREPDAALILGLNRGLFLSLWLLLPGLWLVLRPRRRRGRD